jgi:hypothetical protein
VGFASRFDDLGPERGNDETDGNVQLVRRCAGWSVDGHLTEIGPEIGEAADKEQAEAGCQVLA